MAFIKKPEKFTNSQISIFSLLYLQLIILSLFPIGSNSNEITIKITGIGDQLILSEKYNSYCPSSKYLNNQLISSDSTNCKKINIPEGPLINTIKIEFDETITSLKEIFAELQNLLEVDLSNFDSSSVNDMKDMFINCVNLNSIKLSNLNTASVINMQGMFYGCSSLIELDLSSFDTSKVTNMDFIFRDCINLVSLNISSFVTSNVESMQAMFNNLESLRYLDLSHFDTSKVTLMNMMFWGLKSLTLLDLSNFNTSAVVNMADMFVYDKNLEHLYLINFDTSKVTLMGQMFAECQNLISLDLSSFDTTNVKDMIRMFFNCNKLAYLNLSNFKTQNLEGMMLMFYGCKNLISLDISNLNISHVQDISYLFYDCQKLESLNLSNFKTNSVTNMDSMFSNCYSLSSLDLSNFETSNVQSMKKMFSNCHKLKEIDLSNFDTTSLINAEFMFYDCNNIEYINFKKYNELSDALNIGGILNFISDNVVICIDTDNNNINKLNTEIIKINCSTIDCSNNWKANQKKIIEENNTCVENCTGFNYEYNHKCYSTCPEGADFCQTEKELTEKTDYTNIDFNTNSKEVIMINTKTIISSELISFNINNDENQFSNQIYISSYLTNIHIIENSEQIILSSSSFLYQNKIHFDLYNITGETNEEIYQKIINEAINEFLILKEDDIIIEGKDNFFFEITTTESEKENNLTNKMSKIDLGECENLLRGHYQVNNNTSLIMIKYEKITNISTERSIQYEVYESINITRLNLSICNNVTIDIYTPVLLSEGLLKVYNDVKSMGFNLFDINNDFYQDICIPYTSPNNTDVLLTDRINYYYHNDELVCQSNCEFSNYSIESQLLKCECDISNSEINIKEVKKFSEKTLYESFYDTLKFSNYKVLVCYNLAFHLKNILKNKGSIVTIIYFSLYLIFAIIFLFKGINQLKIDFSKRINHRQSQINNEIIKVADNTNKAHKISSFSKSLLNKNQSKLSIKSSSNKNLKVRKSSSKDIIFKNKVNLPPKKSSLKKELFLDKKKSSANLNKKVQIYTKNINNNNLIINNKFNPINNISGNNIGNRTKTNNNTFSKLNVVNPKEELDNYELNNLEYNEAINLDKRTFIDTYFSILKREHLIIFTFFIRNDHNIIYIKLCRFIFLVCTDMALNVFFFADETMHKMFLDYGKYNFVQRIPQIIYSKIVSQLIEVFLCFLSMTDKHYYQIKNLEHQSRFKVFNIIKCIIIKLAFFFLFTFIMFLFYWYAISCFCAVYVNAQIAFIKDSISSFILGLLYPFILYLFPVLLRIISLRAKKANLLCLFKISDIIPFF